MKHLYITSDMPVSVNHYLGYRAVMRGGKPVAMSYTTKEAAKYKACFSEQIREEVERQKWDITPNKLQHFYVDAVFYFDRTDMDPSNYWKILLDAITDTQLIWVDDNVVCERVQGIYYDKNNPRIELDIFPVQYIGVFEDASHLDNFVSRCVGCNRFSRGCRILGDSKKGFIRDEIVDGVCTKFAEIKGSKRRK